MHRRHYITFKKRFFVHITNVRERHTLKNSLSLLLIGTVGNDGKN